VGIKMENMSIGAFAGEAGVNVETIRFYQRKGLLGEPAKSHGSIRRYGEADVARVRFVKTAQRLGFSLDEVAELLTLDDGAHCDEARHLAEQNSTTCAPSWRISTESNRFLPRWSTAARATARCLAP